MEKQELLILLRDPDICREIYEIFKRGGLPLPVEKKIVQPVEQKNSTSSERERILAYRKKRQAKISQPEIKSDTQKNFFTDKLNFLREQAKKISDEKAAKEIEQSMRTPEEVAAEKYSFVIERVCPICEMKTRVIYTKSRLILKHQDLDLCNHYADFNPYLYKVWSCENCGFAAEDTRFLGHIPQRTKENIREFLQKNNLVLPFIEERTTEDALSFYELAILFSEIFDPSPGRQASLYQKMAWILRYENPNSEREKEFLRKAAELYKISLETERYPIGKITDDIATYIICAIYFMLGDFDNAVKQLSHIMNDQNLRINEPKLFEKARDMWQEIKARRRLQERKDALAKMFGQNQQQKNPNTT